jgi:hypothetical protein
VVAACGTVLIVVKPKTTPSPAVTFTEPKLAAAAMAAGGRLLRADDTPNGRLIFDVHGVPDDFEFLVINDQVQVSARAFIRAMDEVLGLIAQAKRRRNAR